MPRGNPWGVWARHNRSRETVRPTRSAALLTTSLRVSCSGIAATAPTPVRRRAITASIVSRLTNGRAASWTSTTDGPGRNARRPARTDAVRDSPPVTNVRRSAGSLASHSGGRSAKPRGSATTTCPTSGCEMNARNARSSRGTPRIDRNCFGSPGPARTPAPAATITTPTSGGEPAGELTDAFQSDHVETFGGEAGAAGAEDPAEALSGGFGEASLDAADGSDFAPQPHFPEEEGVGGDRAVVDAGDEGRHDGQVGRRLQQSHAARHIDKYVEIGERQPPAAFQNGQQHRQPAVVEAGGDALRRAEAGLRGEGLNLHQHRPRAFHQRRDGRAGDAGVPAGEEGGGRIGDRDQPAAGHLEDPDFIHRPEPVFHRPENAVVQGRFPLEIQHRVDDVLEGAGSRDAATLGDVAHEQDRRPRALRNAHQPARAVAPP